MSVEEVSEDEVVELVSHEEVVVELVVEDESVVDDVESVPSLGGGGGGPSVPWANADWKTPFSSVAWALVSLPEDTSFWIRSSIFDCMSVGDWVVLLLLDWLDLIAESISVNAEDSADWSDEEMVPLETSVCSSASSFCSGDW